MQIGKFDKYRGYEGTIEVDVLGMHYGCLIKDGKCTNAFYKCKYDMNSGSDILLKLYDEFIKLVDTIADEEERPYQAFRNGAKAMGDKLKDKLDYTAFCNVDDIGCSHKDYCGTCNKDYILRDVVEDYIDEVYNDIENDME